MSPYNIKLYLCATSYYKIFPISMDVHTMWVYVNKIIFAISKSVQTAVEHSYTKFGKFNELDSYVMTYIRQCFVCEAYINKVFRELYAFFLERKY